MRYITRLIVQLLEYDLATPSPNRIVRTLRNAPVPRTVSPAAQRELGRAQFAPQPSLQAQRKMCDRVQQELGSRQLQRYAVTMRETELAGVLVRTFEPRSIPEQHRRRAESHV